MAIAVFLAGGNDPRKSFIADATISVKEDFSNQITSYPVDTRSNISDHVFNENPRLSITGNVSNHPVFEYINNEIGYNDVNRADQAHALLKELWFQRTPFDVVTEFDLFTNCVVSRYSTDFTPQTQEALHFTLDVEVIRMAEAQTIMVTLMDSDKIGESGKGTTDNGSDQATALDPNKNVTQLAPAIEAINKSDRQMDLNEESYQKANKPPTGVN